MEFFTLMQVFVACCLGMIAISCLAIALSALRVAKRLERTADDVEDWGRALKGMEARLADIAKSLVSVEARLESESYSARGEAANRPSRRRTPSSEAGQ